MNRLLGWSRDHFSRILGGLLLCAAFVTLLMAPPKPAFSIANCLLFFTFVLTGACCCGGCGGRTRLPCDCVALHVRRVPGSARPARCPRARVSLLPRDFFLGQILWAWGSPYCSDYAC